MDRSVLVSFLLIVFGYLIGSIPTAYVFGRLLRGRDLRQYGSGTVSGSMVWEHVSRWAVVPVGLFDITKAALPAWLALSLDLGEGVAIAAGLASAIGHNWPVYLKFTGGRGISTFIGLLMVVFPWGIPWLGIFLLIGYLLKDSPPFALISLATMPILAYILDSSSVVVWATGIMLLITMVKRLEANRRKLPKDRRECLIVLIRRLFLDRDISSHAEWINRRPDTDSILGRK